MPLTSTKWKTIQKITKFVFLDPKKNINILYLLKKTFFLYFHKTYKKCKCICFLGTPNVAEVVEVKEESSNGGMVTGITLAVVALTLIIVIMMIYYKRRMGRLKSENRAVMQYIQSTEGTDAGKASEIKTV